MQAALNDLSASKRDSPSFSTCQRVLLKCHEIIFSDLTSTTSDPYSAMNILSGMRRRKIKHHPEPVLIGIGAMLSGAPGLPQLTGYMGPIAIDQGRAIEENSDPPGTSQTKSDEDFAPTPSVSASPSCSEIDYEDDDLDSPPSDGPDTPTMFSQKTPTIPKSKLLLRRQTVAGAQTVPALPLHLRTRRRSRAASEDPLGQLDAELNHSVSPYQSSPSIPSSLFSARTPLRTGTINPADALLEKYDAASQAQLLRNHFCLSEVRLLFMPSNILSDETSGAIRAASGEYLQSASRGPSTCACQRA